MDDNWYEIFGYTHDPRSTWDRLQNNDQIRELLTKKQTKIWDQIFRITRMICYELQRSNDLLFLERPFLKRGYDQTVYEKIMKDEGKNPGTIRSEPDEKHHQIEVNIRQYLVELEELWRVLDFEKIKQIFN